MVSKDSMALLDDEGDPAEYRGGERFFPCRTNSPVDLRKDAEVPRVVAPLRGNSHVLPW